MKNIIVGTAGHIDHGKTTLVKALTGKDTDTLAEEKKRGISINLGFTYFDLPSKKRAGIVDVPGHEKFIKNMLAGACGIDIVLLVVAADEGVMPQTIEHLDILTYLNIKKGIVVLTKCDTVDEEFIELAKEDIKEKLVGTFLEEVDIVEVDSLSRRGLDTLVEKIDNISDEIENKNCNSPARLNIDRVFSIKGFGTVITGTIIEGKISIDDELVISPQNIKVKTRSIQVHGKEVDVAYAGQRTAINISNVKVDEIKRGDVLAAYNSLEEGMMVDAKISLSKHSNRALKHWDRLRIYHGTREVLCRVVPLDKEIVECGQDAYVQLRLEQSLVAKKGDKFVIRSYSPLETIGGGVIIDIAHKKHKRFDEDIITSFKVKEKGELKDILEEYLKASLNEYPVKKDIMAYSGENETDVECAINKLVEEDKVVMINNMHMHINKYENLKTNILKLLKEYHKKHRLKKGIVKEELRSKIESKFKTREMDILLDKIYNEKQIKVVENLVSLYEYEVILNEKQKEIKDKIDKKLKSCGLASILTIKDVSENNYYEEVLNFMIGETIVQLDDKHIIHKDIYDKIKNDLIDYLNKNKEITLGEYRDLVGSSRKNCMIILENFDRNKITKRDDNKRTLV